jgi:hypothetical protein
MGIDMGEVSIQVLKSRRSFSFRQCRWNSRDADLLIVRDATPEQILDGQLLLD